MVLDTRFLHVAHSSGDRKFAEINHAIAAFIYRCKNITITVKLSSLIIY